ncbi:hypothetical protein [Metallibacterium scheffleri]|uniref:hypothetical protein n=1 Tax=Metallibacterium scheffleri TaxID=993689 RepID=UPI0010A02356|nr:hypothetical protein [Metallibacterium scheffleri]
MIGTERWDVARYRAYIAGSCVDATGVKTTPPRRRSLELDEQVRFFGFVDLLGERNPQLADALLDVYATANGGKRPRGEAGKLRDSGVRRGVPDIEIWAICKRWLESALGSTQLAFLGHLDQGWNVGSVFHLPLEAGG